MEDLKKDQALLGQVMSKCMVMAPGEAKKDESCVNAGLAMEQLQENMMGNITNMLGK